MALRDAFKLIPEAHLLLFYQLLPPDYPYPLIRVCSTQWGICAIPAGIPPGTPCSCLAAYGGWLPGVCVR
jgi:hypothetical protein